MKRTMVTLLLAAVLLVTPAGAAGRHPKPPEESVWSQIAQLWHHALRAAGLEKDGSVPTPLKWPPATTQDGGGCTDPNGNPCKPNP